MAKAPIEIRSLARNHTEESITRLVYWLRSDNAKASVGAATALLDRGWGKPHQTSDVTVRKAIARDLADDELADIALGGGEGTDSPPLDPSQLN